tara:strand:+ start:510 stop:716 length:207 start_codon:yes stop_codon:yes gene_type:complete
MTFVDPQQVFTLRRFERRNRCGSLKAGLLLTNFGRSSVRVEQLLSLYVLFGQLIFFILFGIKTWPVDP